MDRAWHGASALFALVKVLCPRLLLSSVLTSLVVMATIFEWCLWDTCLS